MVLHNNSFHGEIPPQIGNLLQLCDLDLSNNAFGGPIPSNLSHCLNLETLNFSYNQLVGGIHSNLGNLPRLKRLSLAKNSLVGPIPPSIGNLSSLQWLQLASNRLHGEIPEELSRLERLVFFRLQCNELTGEIPPGIFNISTINYFSVMVNQLRGSFPSDIGITLPSLSYLSVANKLFTGTIPSSLTNATCLWFFEIYNNSFHGPIPKNLGWLKDFHIISLASNRLRDDLSFISSLTNCSNLEILSLSSNLIHGLLPRSMSNLSTSIKRIYLSNNQIQGTIPSALKNLYNLFLLTLDGNFLTGRLPKSIGALYNMQQLDLDGNMFTGEIPSSIGNMTSLALLDLQSNNLQGYIPKSLGNCKQLNKLDLSNNNLIGSVPLEIVGLSCLSILFSLAHNNLTGSLPLQVGSLINLAELDLSYNRLTGLIPASISGCLRLERLHLEANSFQGQIPEALHSLRGLEELDLSYNNFPGPIPSFLADLSLLKYLNLSFNELEGKVPEGGVFLNASAVSISGNKEICGGAPGLNLPLCKSPGSNKFSSTKAILIYVVAVSLSGLALLFLSFFCYRKKKHTPTNASTLLSFTNQFLRISYEELLRATNRFSETNLIGGGTYGTVYKGILDSSAIVAVKVLNSTQRGASRSFVSECQTLGTIRHRNLLKIFSVCLSMDLHGNDFKALIYEFMANESLGEWLHPKTKGQDDEHGESRNLRLAQRLNIAIDIATVIEYLHKGCFPAIVHGDLKPCNVLLDHDMVARVGDFGLAKIITTMPAEATGVQDQGDSTSTAIRGSIGYVPPALPDRAMDVVDLRLWSEASDRQQEIKIRDCMISIFEVGVACSMESPTDRMDMTEAIKKLYSIRVSYEAKENMKSI
ncbi:hypothetical protein BT93_G0719 [Corymbia citriodora subsp. variegata]|nr:hypothetical protein BT93_G0719 [Corymbia citriodora subsp. variegata]